MWERKKCCAQWDMAWFCDRCEKMVSWKTKGWYNTNAPVPRFFCEECKNEIEEREKKRRGR